MKFQKILEYNFCVCEPAEFECNEYFLFCSHISEHMQPKGRQDGEVYTRRPSEQAALKTSCKVWYRLVDNARILLRD